MRQLECYEMKIIIIAYWHDHRFKRKVGGLIRIFDLADNLIKHGHEVLLVLPKIGSPKKQTNARVIEVPFVDFPLIRPISFHLISSLFLFIEMIRWADFVYIRQMNSFVPFLLAKLLRIPSFFEIPNDPFISYQSTWGVKTFFLKNVDRMSSLLADRIVVLSNWSKRRLNQIGKVPLPKILVLPSGTDTDLFRPLSREDCCSKLGIDSSSVYIGFVGSFFSNQGIDTLIDSAPKILRQFTNTRFLLVGDGPMMEAWKRKVNEMGVEWAFIFPGHVPYKQVPEYIGAMDICVAPHRQNTNQASPVKIFDYMSCGRPIVASNIEVIQEIIGDSKCALLVPPECPDFLSLAITSLIEDNELLSTMSIRARKHAMNNYDRKRIVEKLFPAIEKVTTR